MSASDYQKLADLFPDEVVTHSYVQDIALPAGAGTFALVTLDNGKDHTRPTTLGPNTMVELGTTLEKLRERAAAGEIVGVGVIGKPFFLAAGADLSAVGQLTEREHAVWMGQLGHEVYTTLSEMGVPSFVFINGLALGGGLELALGANYRTVSSAIPGAALPEVFLGLAPTWGGCYELPNLIGPEKACQVIIENSMSNNRMLKGPQVLELGIADAMFESADFLEQSLLWASKVISGEVVVDRPEVDRSGWDDAVAEAREFAEAKTSGSAAAPLAALDLIAGAKTRTKQEAFAAEDEALADLLMGDQLRASIYAFMELVQKRAKRPAGAPDKSLARRVTKVGVVGAGLMASQLALLFARQLKVPVVMTDLDQDRVDKGVAYVHEQIDKLQAKKRISPDGANRIKALVSGSVSKDVFADADFVIEAVFEEMSVKKKVFAELEGIIRPDCVLATNTSSLLVSEMAADLEHPERVVGFHFFNPVAVLPLLEVVRTEHTTDEVLATAFATAKSLKKNAVLVKDSTAFVVNRLLGCMFGEITRAFDQGTPAEVADNALKPLGLPMTPFMLLQLVGLPVGQHVQESLAAAFGQERFYVSPNSQKLIDAGIKGLWSWNMQGEQVVPEETLALLEFGDEPLTSEEVLHRVEDALAREIKLMLDEGVVQAPQDIDLCMILGAGWPFHNGGVTPYLDRVGASERVNGERFLPAGVASVPAA